MVRIKQNVWLQCIAQTWARSQASANTRQWIILLPFLFYVGKQTTNIPGEKNCCLKWTILLWKCHLCYNIEQKKSMHRKIKHWFHICQLSSYEMGSISKYTFIKYSHRQNGENGKKNLAAFSGKYKGQHILYIFILYLWQSFLLSFSKFMWNCHNWKLKPYLAGYNITIIPLLKNIATQKYYIQIECHIARWKSMNKQFRQQSYRDVHRRQFVKLFSMLCNYLKLLNRYQSPLLQSSCNTLETPAM